MQKINVIDAELARLHNTYTTLLAVGKSAMPEEVIVNQLIAVQEKITTLYDILDDYNDDDSYDRYSVSDLMDDDTDDEDN